MRLQVTVIRNLCPPIRLIFNTESRQPGVQHVETIAGLLEAINKIVQLQDQAWGLEDYVVETRLNKQQEHWYECLHYQAIKDVLNDEDEVVIRALTASEVRQRRRGGRLQISQGGMHLIDGAPWGWDRPILRDRPKITIAPRRRRESDHVEVDENDEALEAQLQLEGPSSHALVPFLETEEEGQDSTSDEDFNGSAGSSEDERENEDSEDTPGQLEHNERVSDSREVYITTTFDNDDEEEEEDDVSVTELEALNADAQKAGLSPVQTKRKRAIRREDRRIRRKYDAGVDSDDQKSPPTSSIKVTFVADTDFRDDLVPSDAQRGEAEDPEDDSRAAELRNGHQINKEEPLSSFAPHTTSTSSSDSDSSGKSDSDSNSDSKAPLEGDILSHVADPDSDPDSDSDSDSSSDTASDSDLDSDSASSSDSTSDSDESSSDSSESENSVPVQTNGSAQGPEQAGNLTVANSSSADALPANTAPEQDKHTSYPASKKRPQPEKAPVPPGHGIGVTKRNNERKRLNKFMTRLKAEGKLHKDANFRELRIYLEEQEGNKTNATPMAINSTDDTDMEELNARRAEIFQKLNIIESSVSKTATQSQAGVDGLLEEQASTGGIGNVVADGMNPMPNTDAPQTHDIAIFEDATDLPTPKRAKLDLASSRRLVFSALGVRNPKTPAAEQALREKLSKPTRPFKTLENVQMQNSESIALAESNGRWKKKLVIKVVECVGKTKGLELPPFPFQQPWQVRKDKEMARTQFAAHKYSSFHENQLEENDEANVELQYDDEVSEPFAEVIGSQVDATTQGASDLPIPTDFDALFDLERADLVEGAIIAYKEIHITDQFQPEESPYRVAKVLSNEKNTVIVELAARYRETHNARYDEHTGKRIFKKFEMPIDNDDQDDDGLREISFTMMIRPKFVSASDTAEIVIAQSQESLQERAADKGNPYRSASLRRDKLQGSGSSRVAETHPDIDTDRRHHINGLIKDAGFESALDEQLLQPLNAPAESQEEAETLESQHARTDESHVVSNAWRSSPDPTSSPIGNFDESGVARESSVPSESMVESVKYPNLSQLGLSTPSSHVQSSSHQDAQRLDHNSGVDTSALLGIPATHSRGQKSSAELEEIDSLPSEAAQSQSQGIDTIEAQNQDEDRGGIDVDFEHDSIDSNGLPSLRSLTSSQVSKNKSRKSIEKATKGKAEQIRKSPRISKQVTNMKNWPEDEDYSQIKDSQSQNPRLSQIPDHCVIDLTQSSPADSPQKSITSIRSTGERRTVSSQEVSALKKPVQGLGEKRLLKNKRRIL